MTQQVKDLEIGLNYDKYIYENVSKRYFSKDMEILKENISQDSK